MSQPTGSERSTANWLESFSRAASGAIDVFREWKMLDPDYARRHQALDAGSHVYTGHAPMQQSGQSQTDSVPMQHLILGGAAVLALVLILRS